MRVNRRRAKTRDWASARGIDGPGTGSKRQKRQEKRRRYVSCFSHSYYVHLASRFRENKTLNPPRWPPRAIAADSRFRPNGNYSIKPEFGRTFTLNVCACRANPTDHGWVLLVWFPPQASTKPVKPTANASIL